MPVRKKRPPDLRKILVEVLHAASFQGANFDQGANFELEGPDAWLPTSEDQVNHFIWKRTLVWRESKLRRPLQRALGLIDQGQV